MCDHVHTNEDLYSSLLLFPVHMTHNTAPNSCVILYHSFVVLTRGSATHVMKVRTVLLKTRVRPSLRPELLRFGQNNPGRTACKNKWCTLIKEQVAAILKLINENSKLISIAVLVYIYNIGIDICQ